jgi:hypothetical protein
MRSIFSLERFADHVATPHVSGTIATLAEPRKADAAPVRADTPSLEIRPGYRFTVNWDAALRPRVPTHSSHFQ